MKTVNLSFNEYMNAVRCGENASDVLYVIDGNVDIVGEKAITLKGLKINGSVSISADCEDIIISHCDISGNIVCSANGAVIKEVKAMSISIWGNAVNVLCARCVTDAISIIGGYNCVALLNTVRSIEVEDGTNIYVIKNDVSGDVLLKNVSYLLCDENRVSGNVVQNGCDSYNGDNLRDVDARPSVGADEELLPHVNKDQFLDMPRREYVLQADSDEALTFNQYFLKYAEEGEEVIIPPRGVPRN